MADPKPLTPPDRERCQADVTTQGPFQMGGYPGDPSDGYRRRCQNKPQVIVTEVTPGEDGQCGSMSLCQECLVVFNRQNPGATHKVTRLDARVNLSRDDDETITLKGSDDDFEECELVVPLRAISSMEQSGDDTVDVRLKHEFMTAHKLNKGQHWWVPMGTGLSGLERRIRELEKMRPGGR